MGTRDPPRKQVLRSELLASLPRHTAPSRTRTRLIMFNYISLKFKNPLKERIALAAGRCLPTHRGNHRLLCLNYVMLPWLGSRGTRRGLGRGPPRSTYARSDSGLAGEGPAPCWPVAWALQGLRDAALRGPNQETQQRRALCNGNRADRLRDPLELEQDVGGTEG